jgi:hypothetical protein
MFLASKAGYLVDNYIDTAEGYMAKNELSKVAFVSVTLRPKVPKIKLFRPLAKANPPTSLV